MRSDEREVAACRAVPAAPAEIVVSKEESEERLLSVLKELGMERATGLLEMQTG